MLQRNFELFAFEPLETSALENLSTLTGKYGEEGDRLIFKILNSGNYSEKINEEDWNKRDIKKLTPQISKKALRYDLTVPFARHVAMNVGNIIFPFKRYQIQPVWRADRPQKGRFREFYQCDADIIGSESLLQEIEFLDLYFKSFSDLKVPVSIHINNRKILSGLAEYANITNQLVDFTIALDKLDKIGKENVIQEMKKKNISDKAIAKLEFLFDGNARDSRENLSLMKEKLSSSKIGLEGIEELTTVFEEFSALGLSSEKLIFDITLARGLDYYTGAIFEVKADRVSIGSLGGGGRYNNLTEVFGVKNMPGIGISFGLDRIYMVMEELKLFPDLKETSTKFLFANQGKEEANQALKIIRILRKKGISAELYPENAKLKKQFNYAENKGISNLVFLGKEEMDKKTVTVKNLSEGSQKTLSQKDFLA